MAVVGEDEILMFHTVYGNTEYTTRNTAKTGRLPAPRR